MIHEAAQKWKEQLKVDLLINPQRSCLARLLLWFPASSYLQLCSPGCKQLGSLKGRTEGCPPFPLRLGSEEKVLWWEELMEPANLVE